LATVYFGLVWISAALQAIFGTKFGGLCQFLTTLFRFSEQFSVLFESSEVGPEEGRPQFTSPVFEEEFGHFICRISSHLQPSLRQNRFSEAFRS
jgi:hypothetical protein